MAGLRIGLARLRIGQARLRIGQARLGWPWPASESASPTTGLARVANLLVHI